LITIKDLTTVLSKDDKIRSQIFADFRDLTDGYMDKKFGNGVHKTYTDIHSSVLFASTNAIEKYYSLHANLGQRMLFMRPRSDGDKAAAQADKNADKVDIMRKELNEAAGKFMEEMIKYVKTGLPFMFDDQREDMRKAYSFLAKVRTNISHGYGGVIDEIPEPEFPTRIAKSVNRLIQVHAFICGRKIVTADDLAFGLRIVSDNVPTRRLLVLRNLDEKGLIRETIVGKTRLPPKAVDDILTDLIALELVDRGRSGHSKTNNFSISSKVVDAIQSITGVTPPISIWDDLSD